MREEWRGWSPPSPARSWLKLWNFGEFFSPIWASVFFYKMNKSACMKPKTPQFRNSTNSGRQGALHTEIFQLCFCFWEKTSWRFKFIVIKNSDAFYFKKDCQFQSKEGTIASKWLTVFLCILGKLDILFTFLAECVLDFRVQMWIIPVTNIFYCFPSHSYTHIHISYTHAHIYIYKLYLHILIWFIIQNILTTKNLCCFVASGTLFF